MSNREAGPPPDQTRLHEAALAHLARYAATQAGLLRVLDRRVDRWARAADAPEEAVRAARLAARAVVTKLAATGVVDDAAFAAARARSLTRAGRSRRAVAAHLRARGVAGAALDDALPDDPDAELAAALMLARRRRIGPFRAAPVDGAPLDGEARRRELGVLARAGFAQEVAERSLAMDPAAAESLIIRARRA